MGHHVLELFVAPVDEAFEVNGTHVHLRGNREPGVLPIDPFAIPAAARRRPGPAFVGAPVHVVEIDPVEIEIVHPLDKIIRNPVAIWRVEAEPAEVLGTWPPVVEKLHHPLRMQLLERLAVTQGVVGQAENPLLVGQFQEPRQPLVVDVRMRRQHSGMESRRTPIHLPGDNLHVKARLSDQLDVILETNPLVLLFVQ